ncbi:MAG: class I SAM-dependent methyltransferase, partial [Candidatus Aminicenantaceae bacterium]
LYPLFHSGKEFVNSNSEGVISEKNTFDLMTFREQSVINIADDLGNKKTLNCNERYYTPSEITWLLKSLRFKKIDIFGCDIGDFSRKKKLTTENYEMLVVALK